MKSNRPEDFYFSLSEKESLAKEDENKEEVIETAVTANTDLNNDAVNSFTLTEDEINAFKNVFVPFNTAQTNPLENDFTISNAPISSPVLFERPITHNNIEDYFVPQQGLKRPHENTVFGNTKKIKLDSEKFYSKLHDKNSVVSDDIVKNTYFKIGNGSYVKHFVIIDGVETEVFNKAQMNNARLFFITENGDAKEIKNKFVLATHYSFQYQHRIKHYVVIDGRHTEVFNYRRISSILNTSEQEKKHSKEETETAITDTANSFSNEVDSSPNNSLAKNYSDLQNDTTFVDNQSPNVISNQDYLNKDAEDIISYLSQQDSGHKQNNPIFYQNIPPVNNSPMSFFSHPEPDIKKVDDCTVILNKTTGAYFKKISKDVRNKMGGFAYKTLDSGNIQVNLYDGKIESFTQSLREAISNGRNPVFLLYSYK